MPIDAPSLYMTSMSNGVPWPRNIRHFKGDGNAAAVQLRDKQTWLTRKILEGWCSRS